MPRPRPYKSTPYRSPYKKTTYTPAARPQRPIIQYITPASAASGEMKYFDCQLALSSITSVTTNWPTGTRKDPDTTINIGAAAVATPLCLFAPTVGSALNQRIGRKVQVKKIKMRGHIYIPQQAGQNVADAATKIRMLLLVDKQTNATQYTAADVLQGGSVAAVTINGYQNPNGFGRFMILKDKIITVGNLNLAGSPSTSDVVQAGLSLPFKFTYNFKKPLLVNFNATNGGTVSDIIDNSIHFMIGTEVGTYSPQITYYSRVAYTE